jgi:outer membrane lipoprotein-sorting protein
MNVLRLTSALALVGLLAGCYIDADLRSNAPPNGAPAAPGAAPRAPGGALDALEARLMAAPGLRCTFTITSTGPVPAQLDGILFAQPGNHVRLEANGTLEGKPAQPRVVSDGVRAAGGSLDKSFSDVAPPAIGEAVVLGFVRMGLLHNLAMLSSGAPPDGADGSFKSSVVASDVVRASAERNRYDFKILVDGKQRGESSLWLDARSGLPLRRHTTVHFEDGELQVDETYPVCVANDALPPATFAVAPAAAMEI